MAKFTNVFITKNKPVYGVSGAVVPMLLPEYVWKIPYFLNNPP